MEFMKKGLSDTGLKMIALVCMLFDHIHYMFGYTGRIPDWFTVVGRVAMPVFMFCLAEGFSHTRNRRRYFLNIYVLSVLMGLLRFLMQWHGVMVRPDGFFPQNGILSTFAILLVIWQGMDWLKQKKFLKGGLAVLLPLIWPLGVAIVCNTVYGMGYPMGVLTYTVLPGWDVSGTPECSLVILLTGMLIYGLRKKRRLQVAAFTGFSFLYYFVYLGITVSKFMPDFSWDQMFTVYVEWYCVFAGIFMLLYNGSRGRGYKKLFYVFYPAHIYILYALSWAAVVLAGV